MCLQASSGVNGLRNLNDYTFNDHAFVICSYRNKLAIKLPNRLPQFPIPKNLESAYLDDENVERAAPSLAEVSEQFWFSYTGSGHKNKCVDNLLWMLR